MRLERLGSGPRAKAGDPPKSKLDPSKLPAAAEEKIEPINLLDGLRSGELSVTAEGRGAFKLKRMQSA